MPIQLAQRAVLYAAHERRAAAESRGLERINNASVKEAAKFEGEIASLREQIARLEQQLSDSQVSNKRTSCRNWLCLGSEPDVSFFPFLTARRKSSKCRAALTGSS